jgi:hypothetical protein
MPPRPTNNSQPHPANSASKSKPQTPEVAIQTNSSVKSCVPCGEFSRLDEIKARAARVNSNIRKILLTSPTFPRLYADVILHCAPNSREANTLRPHYQTICERVNLMSNQKGTCTHIKVSGVRSGSPALKGEQFCYFHQNVHRGVRKPKQSRLHPIALIEDEDSIQYALMEVINALMRNTIDYKRAALILRALHIAVKNASRVKYGLREPVKQVPDYTPWTEEQAELATQSELPAVSEIPYKPVAPGDPHFWEDQCEGGRVLAREAQARKASVGTDAFVRPGREATVPASSTRVPQQRAHGTRGRS